MLDSLGKDVFGETLDVHISKFTMQNPLPRDCKKIRWLYDRLWTQMQYLCDIRRIPLFLKRELYLLSR